MTKILLVEDDKSLREIYGVRLLAEGYDIVSAGDGEEALAMAIKERPELIISDVMMPKISGFDMLDILRSTTETRDIRVIMMTALSSDDQRARGEQLGADRYLVKSQVGIEDVVHTVHEVLEDAAKGASATPPAAATAPAPTMTPAPSDANPTSTLPEPTAPFTSPRPDNLGERVINPIPNAELPTNVGTKIENELANDTRPAPAPAAPVEEVAAEEPPRMPPQPDSTPVPETPAEPAVEPVVAVADEPAAPVAPAPADGATPAADDAAADPVSAAPAADDTQATDSPAAPTEVDIEVENEGEVKNEEQKPPVA